MSEAFEKNAKPRVLLIEDSRSISRLLQHRMTTSLSVDVICCLTAAECSAVLSQNECHFDVAIVDLNLPGAMDGELLDRVVALGIPAVVFTATFSLDLRDKIVGRGVADYIVKENEHALDIVLETVERLLNNRNLKILVVDDVASARQSLVDILLIQGFQVFQARTGRQALDLLAAEKDISLVLTDYHMPDMDGYKLTRSIRQIYSSDDLRVIGISSSADRLLSASFLKAGACDFVYRPYVTEELQCRINLHVRALLQIRQLRTAAFKDYLTGLFNRRYFFHEGPALVEQCLLNARPCSVAILDVDHFKKLNDTYGHEAGDRVLKQIADRMTVYAHGSPVLLGRLGGEEFGILLPGFNSQQAAAFCDGLRVDLSHGQVMLNTGNVTVTVSIGVAEVGGREVFDNYLHAADQYLYLAKQCGRNRVYCDHSVASSKAVPLPSEV
ncbi:diguanylate cyclase [Agrobacterium vitis]|uniref:diguanylate cyclase n=1 Tax=Agrobacterium vitis TaxID=373 RepID=A0ABD6G8E4_AGRVI|nr:diguanylate cyclase [Agrobacterium vitis]MUO77935.1 diguanylate cyclase [Agrobacterium vitis]MUO96579.1 diguanylate cyclase [Agrobacterium vitis]MUP04804.1 diguanylate cyclase [Agrobacterium vitis]MUZ80811.1 diguanylate cyclase [Agrobacterium vitis]MVA09056.1 diguanylate cyclase [Agrobacterium vitis]